MSSIEHKKVIDSQRNHADLLGSKFHQFLIGLIGVVLAYAIKQLESETLSFSLFPLFIAIFLWGYSFYCGVQSLKLIINIRTIEITKSTSGEFNLVSAAKEYINENVRNANVYSDKLIKYLYFGGGFYFFWVIIEMIILKIN